MRVRVDAHEQVDALGGAVEDLAGRFALQPLPRRILRRAVCLLGGGAGSNRGPDLPCVGDVQRQDHDPVAAGLRPGTQLLGPPRGQRDAVSPAERGVGVGHAEPVQGVTGDEPGAHGAISSRYRPPPPAVESSSSVVYS
nr:hypothetical protein [Actinophytocola oryzae]